MLNKPSTSPETVKRAREIALKNGLNYVYVGNIYDEAGTVPIVRNAKIRCCHAIGTSWVTVR